MVKFSKPLEAPLQKSTKTSNVDIVYIDPGSTFLKCYKNFFFSSLQDIRLRLSSRSHYLIKYVQQSRNGTFTENKFQFYPG